MYMQFQLKDSNSVWKWGSAPAGRRKPATGLPADLSSEASAKEEAWEAKVGRRT